MLSNTAQRALHAYGGADVWSKAERVEAQITLSGLLFLLKRRVTPPQAHIITEIRRPHATITPVDRRGTTGILNGFAVSIASPEGQLIDKREDARQRVAELHGWAAWDSLDLMYFLGYAFWNYFSLPYQLMRDDIEWREVQDGVLEAHFSPELPVHSRLQRFYFDQNGLLARNDYRPDFVSRRGGVWTANMVLRHKTWHEIPYPALRRVSPTQGQFGRPATWLKMVGIQVDNWHLLSPGTYESSPEQLAT
jgi:hypothetical protein